MYKLPGHDGSVNDVDFHPNELICKYIQDFNLYAIYKFAKFLKLVILLFIERKLTITVSLFLLLITITVFILFVYL